jgi:hypothetical protein
VKRDGIVLWDKKAENDQFPAEAQVLEQIQSER